MEVVESLRSMVRDALKGISRKLQTFDPFNLDAARAVLARHPVVTKQEFAVTNATLQAFGKPNTVAVEVDGLVQKYSGHVAEFSEDIAGVETEVGRLPAEKATQIAAVEKKFAMRLSKLDSQLEWLKIAVGNLQQEQADLAKIKEIFG